MMILITSYNNIKLQYLQLNSGTIENGKAPKLSSTKIHFIRFSIINLKINTLNQVTNNPFLIPKKATYKKSPAEISTGLSKEYI